MANQVTIRKLNNGWVLNEEVAYTFTVGDPENEKAQFIEMMNRVLVYLDKGDKAIDYKP